jgi:hypothetical protein
MFTASAGPRRRDQQVGLPAEERGDLQHVRDRGHRRCVCRFVDVGQHWDVDVLPHFPEDRRPSARPGPRNEPSEVLLALSYDALKT